MLEFIVLGHIPGTDVELSFQWLMLVIITILVSLEAVMVVLRHRKASPNQSEGSDLDGMAI